MSDINKVILIGRLAQDPVLRNTVNGTAVVDFTLAVNRNYTAAGEKKKEVSFIRCTAWSKTAEAVAKYTAKGHRVGVDGHLKQQSWKDKDGGQRTFLEVVVENCQFLQTNREKGEQSMGEEVQGKSFEDAKPLSDDEIPF